MCPAGQVQPWSVKCCSTLDELVKMGSLVVQYTDFKQKKPHSAGGYPHPAGLS